MRDFDSAAGAEVRGIALFSEVDLKAHAAIALDFEFSRLPLPGEAMRQWVERVEILSIGLAPVGKGKTFYAAAGMSDRRVSACSEWTRENVIPLLLRRPLDRTWSTPPQLRHHLVEYLLQAESAESRPLVVVADWPGDLMLFHHVLRHLSPRLALALPENDAVAPWRADPERARAGLIRHNALDDAVWLRRVLGFESPAARPERQVA